MLENAVLICFHCIFSKNVRKTEKSRCQKHITDYLTRPIGQRPGELTKVCLVQFHGSGFEVCCSSPFGSVYDVVEEIVCSACEAGPLQGWCVSSMSMSILAQALTSNRTHVTATDYLIAYAPDDSRVDSS